MEDIISLFNIDIQKKQVQISEINKLLKQIQLLDDKQIKSYDWQWLFAMIFENINECNTQIELSLLNLLENLIKRVTILNKAQYYNYFHESMLQTGLLSKIHDLLLQQFINIKGQQNNNQLLSNLTTQLVSIQFMVMKNKKIEQNILQPFTEFLATKISDLINYIKDDSKLYMNSQENDEQFIHIEALMSQIARLLNAIKYIIWENRQFFFSNKLDEIISPLIHLNCGTEIHCQNRLIINPSPFIQQIQDEIVVILHELYSLSLSVRDFLENEHNYAQHVIHLFVGVSQDYLTLSKIRPNDYPMPLSRTDEIKSKHASIQSLLFSLQEIIQYNEQYTQKLVENADLIPSLVNLMKYKTFENKFNFDSDMICKFIPDVVFLLNFVQKCNGIPGFIQLIQSNYIRTLIKTQSTPFALGQQNQLIIGNLLYSFIHYIQQLINLCINQYSYILKDAYEQIEEECGSEELEINQFQLNEDNQTIVGYSCSAMMKLINRFLQRKQRRF